MESSPPGTSYFGPMLWRHDNKCSAGRRGDLTHEWVGLRPHSRFLRRRACGGASPPQTRTPSPQAQSQFTNGARPLRIAAYAFTSASSYRLAYWFFSSSPNSTSSPFIRSGVPPYNRWEAERLPVLLPSSRLRRSRHPCRCPSAVAPPSTAPLTESKGPPPDPTLHFLARRPS